MIILTIGDASRRLKSPSEIEEKWLSSRLSAGRADPLPGVHVRINAPALELNLSAGDQSWAKQARPLEPLEARVLELWHQRGLDRPGYRSGQLAAFLRQVCDVLEPHPPRMDSGVQMPRRTARIDARAASASR